MTKLNGHCRGMLIQNCCKFHEIAFGGYLICLTQFVDFKQFRGNNSLHTEVILAKCKTHPCVIVLHILCKLHRILYICDLVTAEFDNFTLNQGQ